MTPRTAEDILDDRQVQHRCQVGVGVAVSGDAVAALDVRLDLVELGLVGDVADDARLGTGAVESALRTLQDLDAVQVRGVDVEIAVGQLAGLVVQVDGDVGPQAGRGAALAGLRAGAQAAHEDFVLPRTVVGGRDVRQILDVVVERRDVELLQASRR